MMVVRLGQKQAACDFGAERLKLNCLTGVVSHNDFFVQAASMPEHLCCMILWGARDTAGAKLSLLSACAGILVHHLSSGPLVFTIRKAPDGRFLPGGWNFLPCMSFFSEPFTGNFVCNGIRVGIYSVRHFRRGVGKSRGGVDNSVVAFRGAAIFLTHRFNDSYHG